MGIERHRPCHVEAAVDNVCVEADVKAAVDDLFDSRVHFATPVPRIFVSSCAILVRGD